MADYEGTEQSPEELEEFFTEATEYVRTLRGLSDQHKLLFYGLFKQAKEGPCKTSRPGFWDMVGRAKWDSWHHLGDMSNEMAMKSYVRELFTVDAEWDIKYVTADKSEITHLNSGPKQSMGLAVSTLRGGEVDDIISDDSKTIFDWCKEGNVKRMNVMLSTGNLNIDSKDNQGLSLLHWACDRGHEHVVHFLIKHNVDVNVKDADGQTALHYDVRIKYNDGMHYVRFAMCLALIVQVSPAATCEFLTIVQQLLDAKALTSIADDDGCLAVNGTDNKAIKDLLEAR